ncbi:hypothetical protein P368_08410 [Comamonas thiooxydans]|nr:hypothetical protein P369_11550 [Comamonas thiooxydans]KGH00084.1 hypothetical protein P367_07465 [Comamonas thiooxydans]KGH05714.1 hypothetical protein P365_08760 [Comamonas thiooxydans]KGH13580.1 hypothetical protein P368_08410 [Comamonas thiooxydans]
MTSGMEAPIKGSQQQGWHAWGAARLPAPD